MDSELERSRSLISDAVPTRSDELSGATRLDLARALRSYDAATDATVNDDVFGEDTIEAFTEPEPTLV